MSKITYALAVSLLFVDCAPEHSDEPDQPFNVSIQTAPLQTDGKLPAFTAPNTEALLQPAPMYANGTYNHRSFGCCSPRHLGWDFQAPAATPVKAIAPGVVLPSPVSGPHCKYGNVVVVWSKLTDGTEFTTIYGHMSGRVGLEPTFSGNVQRDHVIGYVGHSGGTSPAGARCGPDDDENGDGAEHVHIAIRMGAPPIDAQGNLLWAYYGYAGSGEDVDQDSSGVSHGGNFTSVVDFANCHGTHAGAKPDLTLVTGASSLVSAAYCGDGGYARLGDSVDVGKGNGMNDWNGVWCQNFKRTDTTFDASRALCLNSSRTRAIDVPWAIWYVYSLVGSGTSLGAPTSDAEQLMPDGLRQRFDHGTITVIGNSRRVLLDDGTAFEVNGDTITTVGDGSMLSSSSSSSSTSSSSSSTMSSSASSSSSISSSSSSSSSSASSSSAASSSSGGASENDPPYTTCGRFGSNRIVNGEFNFDPLSCGWMLENSLGGGHAIKICDETSECRAKLWTTTPLDPWRTQLKQYVPVRAGKRYLFRFRITAETADRFIVQLMKEDSPWTNYGLWIDQEIPGGYEQQYDLVFTATTNDDWARLTFQFGQTSTAFTIDKLWLEELLE